MIVFLFLFVELTSCSFLNDEHFISLIDSREIIINGKEETLKTLFENNHEIPTMESFIKTYPNIVYTALECKYADIIVQMLQAFYEVNLYGILTPEYYKHDNVNYLTIVWLKSSTKHFLSVKPLIQKIIYTLFFYLDTIPALRTSDQNLLKSLLEINFFMYHIVTFTNETRFIFNKMNSIERYKETKVDKIVMDGVIEYYKNFNRSTIQMIGFIERFRLKKCVVRDIYEHHDYVNSKFGVFSIHYVRSIRTLFYLNIRELNTLIDSGKLKYDEFTNQMYDPNSLLFVRLLEHEDHLINMTDVKSIKYKTATFLFKYKKIIQQKLSLPNVLQFQNLICDVVADIFYRKIYDSLTNPYKNEIEKKNLLKSFDTFITNILPNNCVLDVCNRRNAIQVHLRKAIKDYSEADVQFIKETVRNIQSKSESQFYYRDNQNILGDDPDLSLLVDFIMNNEQFKPFRQVLRLLSFESHTNINIFIIRYVKDDLINASRKHDKILNYTDELRYSIISFQSSFLTLENKTKLKNAGSIFTPSTGYLGTSSMSSSTGSTSGYDNNQTEIAERSHEVDGLKEKFEYIFCCIIEFYEEIRHIDQQMKTKYKNALLPSMIYFRNTDQFVKHIYTSNFVVLRQILLVTVTALEQILLEQYDWPDYSIHIYSIHVKNIRTALKNTTQVSSEKIKLAPSYSVDLYHNNLHDDLFQENYTEIQFYWNGSKMFGFEILSDISQGVIDHDLVHFH